MALLISDAQNAKQKQIEKSKKQLENMEISQYTLRIPTHLYKKVRIKLAKEDLKLRPLLVKLLEEYVNDK